MSIENDSKIAIQAIQANKDKIVYEMEGLITKRDLLTSRVDQHKSDVKSYSDFEKRIFEYSDIRRVCDVEADIARLKDELQMEKKRMEKESKLVDIRSSLLEGVEDDNIFKYHYTLKPLNIENEYKEKIQTLENEKQTIEDTHTRLYDARHFNTSGLIKQIRGLNMNINNLEYKIKTADTMISEIKWKPRYIKYADDNGIEMFDSYEDLVKQCNIHHNLALLDGLEVSSACHAIYLDGDDCDEKVVIDVNRYNNTTEGNCGCNRCYWDHEDPPDGCSIDEFNLDSIHYYGKIDYYR